MTNGNPSGVKKSTDANAANESPTNAQAGISEDDKVAEGRCKTTNDGGGTSETD
jgi:hypothetical protein